LIAYYSNKKHDLAIKSSNHFAFEQELFFYSSTAKSSVIFFIVQIIHKHIQTRPFKPALFLLLAMTLWCILLVLTFVDKGHFINEFYRTK
tara:strand:- start:1361 stop:1630 length:270 start_codon:yes stop_codon:yes gene_type:complete